MSETRPDYTSQGKYARLIPTLADSKKRNEQPRYCWQH